MTTTAELVIEQPGLAVLRGRLDFATVPQVWLEVQAWLVHGTTVTLSLREVTTSNSAALALLLEAISSAQEHAVTLSIQDIPTDLLDLARLSNLDELLLALKKS